MHKNWSNNPSRIAVLPAAPETRLLVALTSHASDLSEAAHTLRHAFEAGEGSELWLPLTSHAVTAYIRPLFIRTFAHGSPKCPASRALPATLAGVHDVIRKYRNTTVAHSHSELILPRPVAFLDAAVRGVKISGRIDHSPDAFDNCREILGPDPCYGGQCATSDTASPGEPAHLVAGPSPGNHQRLGPPGGYPRN